MTDQPKKTQLNTKELIQQARKELKQLKKETDVLRIQKDTIDSKIIALRGLFNSYEKKYNDSMLRSYTVLSKLNDLEAQQRNKSYEK